MSTITRTNIQKLPTTINQQLSTKNQRPMIINKDNPVFSRNVVEFVTVALEYCTFLENCSGLTARDFASALLRLLPVTYVKCSMLPNIEPEEDNLQEDFVTEEIYKFIENKISKKLGEYDLECEVPETVSQNEENTTAQLSEILTDIYQDLKNFVMSYKTGEENLMKESVFVCKLNFEQFWGARLANAQPVIHKLVYGETDWDQLNKTEKLTGGNSDSGQWIITKRQQEWGYDS